MDAPEPAQQVTIADAQDADTTVQQVAIADAQDADTTVQGTAITVQVIVTAVVVTANAVQKAATAVQGAVTAVQGAVTAGALRTFGAVAAGVVVRATLTDVYYCNGKNTKRMRDAIVRVFCGERDDRDVGDINRGSLIVDLHCHTAESFLQFLKDYESGQAKRDLKEELLKIGIAVEKLSIKIKNEKEIEEHKEKLRKCT